MGTKQAKAGQGLTPAMEVRAPIVAVHPLKKGRSISYGGMFTAKKNMTVAIVAAGYADGYSRGLSNKAEMVLI